MGSERPTRRPSSATRTAAQRQVRPGPRAAAPGGAMAPADMQRRYGNAGTQALLAQRAAATTPTPRPVRTPPAQPKPPIPPERAMRAPAEPAPPPLKPVPSRMQKPMQAKLAVGPAGDKYEREADDAARRVTAGQPVQRISRLPAGGTALTQRICPECAKEAKGTVQRWATGGTVQRRCGECTKTGAAQAPAEEETEETTVQRAADSETGLDVKRASDAMSRSGSGRSLAPSMRARMEQSFGRDLKGVRVHTDTASHEASEALNARAFTLGSDIYLGRGQSPDNQSLMAHELTHVVQQGGTSQTVQRQFGDFGGGDFGGGGAGGDFGGGSAGGGGAGGDFQGPTTGPTAQPGLDLSILEEARALAGATGGMISLDGGRLTILVPPMSVCPTMALDFTLPEISYDRPFGMVALPISEAVSIYGSVGLHVGLTPQIGAQLGPCTLHGLRIVLDPLGGSFSAMGAITTTTAILVGGELRVGAFGEVGALAVIPPIVLQIPVVHMEVGLSASAVGIAISTIDLAGALSYSSGRLHLDAAASQDLGVQLTAGLAGYGSLSLLGTNICTLYWPLAFWQRAMTISTDLAAALDAGPSGISAALVLRPPRFDEVNFDDMPLLLQATIQSDDCPLCDALYAAGLMPSQRGGAWAGHPEPPWGGPLFAYPMAPAIPSGAKCRGACGVDCDPCGPPVDREACEDLGTGYHRFWNYPNYVECGSHQGCRDHDACYDWCAAGGETSIIGPCHRLCDFEVACNYGVPQGVNWALGGGPYDSTMPFSNAPSPTVGCRGPCPEKLGKGSGPGTKYQLVLPDIILFNARRKRACVKSKTKKLKLLEKDVFIPEPPIGLVTLDLVAEGNLKGCLSGSLGPGRITGLVLEVDPFAGTYSGKGEVRIPADLNGEVTVNGALSGSAKWFRLVTVVCAEGCLSGTGRATAKGELGAGAKVEFTCDRGEPGFHKTLSFALSRCLGLTFDLDALFDLEVLGFRLISERWKLLKKKWNKCWGGKVELGAMAVGDSESLDLSANAINVEDVLTMLFSSPGNNELPAPPPSPEEEETEQRLKLPPQKTVYFRDYAAAVRERLLQHRVGRDRDTDQSGAWDDAMDPTNHGEMTIETFCWGRALGLSRREVLRPRRSRLGLHRDMNVDHRIEIQVATIGNEDAFDMPANYEMLEETCNKSAGARLKNNIIEERERLEAATGDPSWQTRDLTFTRVLTDGSTPCGRWTFEEVRDGKHLSNHERQTGERRDQDLFEHCLDKDGRI